MPQKCQGEICKSADSWLMVKAHLRKPVLQFCCRCELGRNRLDDEIVSNLYSLGVSDRAKSLRKQGRSSFRYL